MAEYLSTDLKNAKVQLNAILHMGLPQTDLPMLWNLATDVQKAIDMILLLPDFEYLQGRFGDRRNPQATRFHYAMASIEDQILTDLTNELSMLEGVHDNLYLFDGMLVLVPMETMDQVRSALQRVGEKWKVSFSSEIF